MPHQIKIKCPNPECGCVLTVSTEGGLEARNVACLHCHNTYPFKKYYPQRSLIANGRKYQLHFGRQWVGRKASNNDAEVQIPGDNYMSRRHAIIELSCTATGIECTYEDHGRNPTEIGGIELTKEDIIYLNVGDCLVLGRMRMYLAADFE